jgi:predicted DNA-binding transcriptional regulator YafY
MSVLERLYFFHEQISAGRYPGIAVLMDEFEVSRATAHRDIAYLNGCSAAKNELTSCNQSIKQQNQPIMVDTKLFVFILTWCDNMVQS